MASSPATRGSRKGADADGLARSGGYTPLNQSISRVVINLFTLTQEFEYLEQSLRCFELLSMDGRLATVPEVEGHVLISQGWDVLAICQ